MTAQGSLFGGFAPPTVPLPPAWDRFSSDGRYRYALGYPLAHTGPVMVVIGLNPSSARATGRPDPTMRKVSTFARRERASLLIMLNPWALVSTDPAGLLAAGDPVGEDNDATILELVPRADILVVAWGAEPYKTKEARRRLAPRIADVRRLLSGSRPPLCFGLNDDGSPRHPLYLAANTPLVPYVWEEAERR